MIFCARVPLHAIAACYTIPATREPSRCDPMCGLCHPVSRLGPAESAGWPRSAFAFVLAADRSPLPSGPGLQVERPELVNAEHDRRVAGVRDHVPAGDRAQVLDPRLLRRVPRVFRRLPGFQALKGDALLAEQHPQPLVADVVDHPSATRNSASLARLQVENGRSYSAGFALAIFLVSRRCARVNFGGRPHLCISGTASRTRRR
jgi:hypothetical protein